VTPRCARLVPRVRLALCLGSFVAAGCATLPAPPAGEGEFALAGRVAVRYGAEAASGRVTWRHSAAADELLIASPLGQGIAEITRRNGAYTLVASEGQRYTAGDAERLTEQALGWALPLGGLSDWVQGRPQPGVPAWTRYEGERLTELQQAGWTIEYLEYDEAVRRPRRLRLSRGELDIRLAIEEWRVGAR